MLLTDQPIYRRVYAHVQAHNDAQQHAHARIDKNRYAMLRTVTELAITEARRVVASPRLGGIATADCYTNRRELRHAGRLRGADGLQLPDVLERAGLVQKLLHGRQNDFEWCCIPGWFLGRISPCQYPAVPGKNGKRKF